MAAAAPIGQAPALDITPAIEGKIIKAGDQIVRDIAAKLKATIQVEENIQKIILGIKGECQSPEVLERIAQLNARVKVVYNRMVTKTVEAVKADQTAAVTTIKQFDSMADLLFKFKLIQTMTEFYAIDPSIAIVNELDAPVPAPTAPGAAAAAALPTAATSDSTLIFVPEALKTADIALAAVKK